MATTANADLPLIEQFRRYGRYVRKWSPCTVECYRQASITFRTEQTVRRCGGAERSCGADQSGVGRSTESITRTSNGKSSGCSRRPSCSCKAVKIETRLSG